MAYSKAANDKAAIRHDAGSLFGGITVRDVEDSQVLTSDGNGSISFTSALNSRVTYKAVSNAYTSTGTEGTAYTIGIDVRSNYEDVFQIGGSNSSTDDYMLDWGKARFNSITLELWDVTNEVWVTSFTYVDSRGPGYALPNRATSDTDILDDLRSDTSSTASATYTANYDNWEYQCALYNWQYPEGSSYIQYLFGNDNLGGTRNNDCINGGAGNDVINGGSGNDVLNGSFGQDTLYGDAGNDVIIFSGGSNVWNYKADSTATTSKGAYTRGIDMAAGGSGKDYFVFELPTVNYHAGDSFYPAMPDLYGNASTSAGNYNPFLSQSLNATPISIDPKSFNVSLLTFRTRILDFKVGEDKLDLSNYGIDQDFLTNKALTKLSGTAFVTAVNTALKPDGLQMVVGKNGFTSNNTTLFIQEVADTNGNGRLNDTLLEIQLVGIASSAISIKMFGDTPLA
jgi:Ca2+-binding RTX toxin-like protein